MISVLSSDADVAALAPEWAALWERTPSATPFQSSHWLLPWWDQFGTGLPRVAISREHGQLTGVLPLYILPEERKALPIGAGATDYLDVLGDSAGLLDAVLATMGADLVARCDLIDIPPTSPLLRACAPGWRTDWQEAAACPVLILPGISKLARRKLVMNRNRADRSGGWKVIDANPETIHLHLDSLKRLHQARWIARGEPGVMADPRVDAFWRQAGPRLLSAGLLRLNSLLIAGEMAAVIAALIAPDRIFFYLSGFDEAYAFVSPGTILLGAMLEQAVAEGRFEAHFLRGRESYKYAWGAEDRFNWTGRFVSE